jgi:basic membrane protein A
MKESGMSKTAAVVIAAVIAAVVVGLVVYFAVPGGRGEGGGEMAQSEVESFLDAATPETLQDLAGKYIPQETLSAVSKAPRNVTIGAEWFSIIEGTTWTYQCQKSLDWLLDEYPYVEAVVQTEVMPDNTNPVAERMIREKDADIIIANTEFMAIPLKEIKDKYPDKYFVSQTNADIQRGRNWIRYYAKQYQSTYLAGLLAGALTKTNHIGVIGAMYDIVICRRINGFTLGVQEVNPKAKVHMLYCGSWFDPPSEKEIAETLVDRYDCDVLTQQTDSSAGVKVAQEKGIWYIGKDSDFVDMGWDTGETVATSFVVRWQVIWERILKDYMAGDDTPENLYFLGMEASTIDKNGNTILTVDLKTKDKLGIDSISDKAKAVVSKDVLDLIDKRRDQMINGTWDPYMKEIRASGITSGYEKGQLISPEGEMPTKEELLTGGYLVEGIIAPSS